MSETPVGIAEENERVHLTLEQASREIELMNQQNQYVERRRHLKSDPRFGILVADDEHAREYQRLELERRKLEDVRLAKLKVLSHPAPRAPGE